MNTQTTTSSGGSVISIRDLSRRFGGKLALDHVHLELPRGCVFGLVGANGAGKTTLLKHVLGLLKAEAGVVEVFGLNPVLSPAEVLGRIGFLSEDRDLPNWMRVDELLRYTKAFYPRWDDAYAGHLRDSFGLDARARVKALSRGELAKLGLLLALAHRPELLVLDEPSSGLDPLVRRDMLEAVVRAVADEGRTVLFSSHLLDEIERVSDRIAMMAGGRIVLEGSLDQILECHRRITLRFPERQVHAPRLDGALEVRGGGLEWTAICNGARERLLDEATRAGAVVVEETGAVLDEIFAARVGAVESRGSTSRAAVQTQTNPAL